MEGESLGTSIAKGMIVLGLVRRTLLASVEPHRVVLGRARTGPASRCEARAFALWASFAGARMQCMLTPNELRERASRIYSRVRLGLRERLTTINRPLYAPLHLLLDWIPRHGVLLDVGCGTGAWIMLADSLRLLSQGLGFDLNMHSIEIANQANTNPNVRFSCEELTAPVHHGAPACVSCIDVLHHIPRPNKHDFLQELMGLTPVGGRLIIKDLDPRPRWSSLFNHVTDFASTRSRVSHVTMQEVVSYISQNGFDIIEADHCTMYVWRHYYIVATKQAAA
jgi:2-polyprenyl-3-methyl-5-hydroxy-6-metoxy-1,4-benzoquinol methylase